MRCLLLTFDGLARITWRLCFYINLPFGLVTAICVVFFLSSTDGEKPNFKLPVKEKMKQLDFIGLAAFIPTIVCLVSSLGLNFLPVSS